MTTLEKIFQGYYEERAEGDQPDPVEMKEVYDRILQTSKNIKSVDVPELLTDISIYGMQAEKTGFMAGFRMAWTLLEDMQEGVV
jgi:hypothetical protein